MNFRLLLFVPLLIVLLLNSVFAEEGSQEKEDGPAKNQPPQILSPDLIRKQEVVNSEQVFSFIFIDSDMINRITINNEEQVFSPAKRVVIIRKFSFNQGKSLIRVVAEDENGNSSERSFLIGYGEKELKYIADTDGDNFKWQADVSLGFELDENPTNDMSSAIEPLYGVVIEDNQADTRLRLDGVIGAEYDGFSVLGGLSMTRYSKGENDFLNSQLMFAGFGYQGMLANGRSWVLDAMLTDINVGEYDYAFVQTLSPGLKFRSRGKRGEFRLLTLGLDVISKDFAIISRTDGVQGTLKYDFRSLDLTKKHLFHHLLAIGTSTEGTKQSEYTFTRFDFDWKNTWDYGLRWDFGLGMQHRTFANDTALSSDTKLVALGSKHIDLPFRVEMGIGWKFSESLKTMFNTKYVFNLSNDVSYKRLINGITVRAIF